MPFVVPGPIVKASHTGADMRASQARSDLPKSFGIPCMALKKCCLAGAKWGLQLPDFEKIFLILRVYETPPTVLETWA
jgi:hypothetical protein